MNWAIETKALRKDYGDVRAVDNLSLRVAEGEIYAFLGLNGAGKTTTIRMLLGMIRPSQGSLSVLGTPIHLGQREPWAQVGYLVETPRAYPELTVRENLEVARRCHPGTPPSAVDQIIQRLGLAAYARRRTANLSQGNAQRLGLAKALIHSPRLLFLDEPANGLDPAGIIEIRELLRELTQKDGVTVFMSSHILAEVARLAQRIGVIHQGRLIQEMDRSALEQNRRRRLLVTTRNQEIASQVLQTAGCSVRRLAEGVISLENSTALDRPDEISRLLVEAGVPPTSLRTEEEELEDYFLRLIGQGEDVAHV